MATLVRIKYSGQKDHSTSVMRSVLNYCLQPEKTHTEENLCTVSGQNCTPRFAYREFMANKAVWKKQKGLCFRHYVQSFHPNEKLTPEEANRIGVEFAQKVWQGYGVVVATHVDREHLHNHFIIDTVHIESGRKLHEGIDNIKNLRKVNDEICLAHGLTILSPYGKSKTKSISTREYRSGNKGESWKFRLRAAIKYCMEYCATKEEFIAMMKRCGYGVRWEENRKHLTYTCYREPKYQNGGYKKCRDTKLSDEKYCKENMENEFKIRKEILVGRDDGEARNRRTRRDFDGTTYGGGLDEPTKYGGRAPNVGAGADAKPKNSTEGERSFSADGERVGGRRADNHSGGSQETDGRNEKYDGENGKNTRSTGWEVERKTYLIHRETRKARKNIMGRSPISRRNSKRVGLAIGGIAGLASVIDEDDSNKTPEEIEAEERARLAAENVNAVLELVTLGIELTTGNGEDEEFTIKM